MSEDADVADDAGALPSGRAVFERLGEVASRTSDGGYQAPTIYVEGTPLATLVPFQEPVVWEHVPADVTVRLSRFTYLHRVGRDIRVETPLSILYLELHDPRAAAVISAMAFDRSARDIAAMVDLPVEAVQGVLGLMQAMHAADTVVEQRDPSAPIAALLQWAAAGGVPGSWWNPDLGRALADLPWSELGDNFEVLWELHHLPSEGQADISLSIPQLEPPGIDRPAYREFDLHHDGSALMGEFFSPNPIAADAGEDVARALDEHLRLRGHSTRMATNTPVVELLSLLGAPLWVGITPGRDGVRLVFPVVSREHLASVAEILRGDGFSSDVVARIGLFESVVGGVSLRLAIDAVGGNLGPRVGFEIASPAAISRVPGLLDALGVAPEVAARVDELITTAREVTRLEHAPGVVTDEHSTSISHVKVGFEADGKLSVKTYLAFRNMPLAVGGRSVEDVDVPPTWEFHDLLFHSRSRNGRVREKLGGTARFSIVPQPITYFAEPMPGDIALPDIDLASTVQSDRPFGEVLRIRESDRDWSGPEIPLARLGELLGRVMEVIPREMEFGNDVQHFDGQPYPSGGAIYEVDVVVVAHRVSDLEQGAYLYRRGAHALEPLHGEAADLDSLLFAATEATGSGMTRPQALLVLAARFPDLAVKYQGIAYALMLKHVGVLQATIAYTAVAMGLGAVPIGTGDSDAFARATGLDYYAQGSIGEIAISEPPR